MFFDFKKTKSINSPTLGRIGKAEIYPARVIKSMINATSQPTAFKELGE